MWGKAKPIPDGFNTITPSLVVKDATRAIDFYKVAFGAEPMSIHSTEDGKVMNAMLRVGDSMLMLSDEFPGSGFQSPESADSRNVILHLYVENADETFNRAISAGATATLPMADAFWGDRYGQFQDPFGHSWSVATHKEDLSEKDIAKRGKEAFAEMAKKARQG
ncbi:MAG: VOC family protein [Terriglobia bacterium]